MSYFAQNRKGNFLFNDYSKMLSNQFFQNGYSS